MPLHSLLVCMIGTEEDHAGGVNLGQRSKDATLIISSPPGPSFSGLPLGQG